MPFTVTVMDTKLGDGRSVWPMATPVHEHRLPLSLLESFRKLGGRTRTIDLLRFILPLTTASVLQEI